MVIELLPECSYFSSIYMRRVRLFPERYTKDNRPILGAGIDYSSEIALDKAVSEVIERYVVYNEFPSLRCSQKNICVNFSNDVLSFKEIQEVSISSEITILSSSCHFTLYNALQCAVVEAIERKHVYEWCKIVESSRSVAVAMLDINSAFISRNLRNFFASRKLRFVLSWTGKTFAFPAFVCFAIDFSKKTFYAMSAGAISCFDAIEKMLLDCVKMLLMEEYSLSRGRILEYDYPLDVLPKFFVQKLYSDLPIYGQDGAELLLERDGSYFFGGSIYVSSYAIKLRRSVVSIIDNSIFDDTNLLRCFK